MTQAELATAVQENVDVNIAIINNGYLGMVRQWQEFFYEERYNATPMHSPDFCKLADAYGIPAFRVTDAPCDSRRRSPGGKHQGAGDRRVPRRKSRHRVPDGSGGR